MDELDDWMPLNLHDLLVSIAAVCLIGAMFC